jgi:hypothetical protein
MQAVNSASVRHWRIVKAEPDDGGDELEESMSDTEFVHRGETDQALKAELRCPICYWQVKLSSESLEARI